MNNFDDETGYMPCQNNQLHDIVDQLGSLCLAHVELLVNIEENQIGSEGDKCLDEVLKINKNITISKRLLHKPLWFTLKQNTGIASFSKE